MNEKWKDIKIHAGGGIFVAPASSNPRRPAPQGPKPCTVDRLATPASHVYIYGAINFFVMGKKLKSLIILALFKLYVLTRGGEEIHSFSFKRCIISVLHIL